MDFHLRKTVKTRGNELVKNWSGVEKMVLVQPETAYKLMAVSGKKGVNYMPRDLKRSGIAQRPMAIFVAPQIFVIMAFCLYHANGSKMVNRLMSRSTVANGHIAPRRIAL